MVSRPREPSASGASVRGGDRAVRAPPGRPLLPRSARRVGPVGRGLRAARDRLRQPPRVRSPGTTRGTAASVRLPGGSALREDALLVPSLVPRVPLRRLRGRRDGVRRGREPDRDGVPPGGLRHGSGELLRHELHPPAHGQHLHVDPAELAGRLPDLRVARVLGDLLLLPGVRARRSAGEPRELRAMALLPALDPVLAVEHRQGVVADVRLGHRGVRGGEDAERPFRAGGRDHGAGPRVDRARACADRGDLRGRARGRRRRPQA